MMPNSPSATTRAATLPLRNVAIEKSRGSRSVERPSRARRRDQATNAIRDAPLAAAERRIQERQRARQHHRSAHALHETGEDQQVAGRREGRRDRGPGEQDDADQQQSSSPDAVGERAEQQQQRREHERVGLLHPLHLRRGDLQVVDDRRDRHVHDRGVDDDQGDREADEDETEPAPARDIRNESLAYLAKSPYESPVRKSRP